MRHTLFALLMQQAVAALGSGNTPTLDLNLALAPGSSLPAGLTLSSPARTYLNAGVLSSIAANTPPFESWDGANRGLALEAGFTNLFLQSGDLTLAATGKSQTTVVAGDVGPGLITQMYTVAATATSNYHSISQSQSGVASGTTQVYSAYFKAASGATNYSLYLNLANQFNNSGECYHFRIDGNEGFYYATDNANMTNVTYGWQKLSGGIYRVWIKGIWSGTGNKNYKIGVTAQAQTDTRNYNAPVTDSVQVFGPQIATATGLTSYVATGASAVSLAATSCSFSDTSWLTTTSQGTFIVEHDALSGPVLGSGSNTLISASGISPYGTTRVALAWSGTTSDLVTNGGATTAGGLPTFSGTDIRLLATSGTQAIGHIRRITFYPVRLSVAAMQAATLPTIVSTATPGVYRTASVDNRMETSFNTTSGSALTFITRARVKLAGAGYACSGFKVFFPNFSALSGATGNAFTVTECYLERVTGVSEYVPVKVGGATTFTVPDGGSYLLSDVILPSAFTNLTQFNASMEFQFRIKGTVASAGMKIPAGRAAETYSGSDSVYARIYNPATVSYSSMAGTGQISVVSGSDPGQLTTAYCPILLGTFVSGDPATALIIGDSLVAGTGNLGQVGSFMTVIHRNLEIPKLEISLGGMSQTTAQTYLSLWGPCMAYARIMYDMMGTNDPNNNLAFFSYWKAFRSTYGGDKIVKFTLLPNGTWSGTHTTEAEQTVNAVRPYPGYIDLFATNLLTYGAAQAGVDGKLEVMSIRGTNQAKWLCDNVTANLCTTDCVHPTNYATGLIVTEVQPLIAAIAASVT